MAADVVSVLLLPEVLSFGCICQGFVYQLQVTILNKGNRPQYFKIACIPHPDNETNSIRPIYNPRSVAPGLSISFELEIRAELAINSKYELIITEGIKRSSISQVVTALIVPLNVFRHVTKSLELQQKSLYRHGVRPVSTTLPLEEISLISGGHDANNPPSVASVISEALMDGDDIQELLELPMQPNLYWDPFERALKLDFELGQVLVDPSWTMQESEEKTRELREKRYKFLEDKGFYTVRTIARFAHMKTNSASGLGSGLEGSSSFVVTDDHEFGDVPATSHKKNKVPSHAHHGEHPEVDGWEGAESLSRSVVFEESASTRSNRSGRLSPPLPSLHRQTKISRNFPQDRALLLVTSK